MIEDASWILKPLEHRKYANAEAKVWLEEPHDDGVERLSMGIDLPLDLWVCDFCNGDIDVIIDGDEQYVPMLSNNALCWECVEKTVKKDTTAADMYLGGVHPFLWWSSMCCGCPPCKEEGLTLAEKLKPIMKDMS